MQLSIKDASQQMIGAAKLRRMALEASPNSNITLQQIVASALKDDDSGKRFRMSIRQLADEEKSWFRNNPPNALATNKVMETRAKEISSLNNLNIATFTAIETSDAIRHGDLSAGQTLNESLANAIRSIDELSGSVSDRREIFELFNDETTKATGNKEFMEQQINTAQKKYLQDLMDERMRVYNEEPDKTTANDNDDKNLSI